MVLAALVLAVSSPCNPWLAPAAALPWAKPTELEETLPLVLTFCESSAASTEAPLAFTLLTPMMVPETLPPAPTLTLP